MSRSHFGHEFRAALREARLFLPIPGLVTLLALCLWHFLWATHSAAPLATRYLSDMQHTGGALINAVWPWVAWLVPYAILKFPDLKQSNAFWRSLPLPARHVFGTRILLALVFTVITPSLITAGFLALVLPEYWVEQTTTVLLNQATFFTLGVFAALAAPNHRGILTLGVMTAAVLLAHRVVGDLAMACDLGAGAGAHVLLPLARYGLALAAPLITALLIRHSERTLRLRTWAYGAASAGVIIAIAEIIIPAPAVRNNTRELPALEVALRNPTPEENAAEAKTTRRAHGADAREIVTLGRADLDAFPAGFLPDGLGWNERFAELEGTWRTDRDGGRLRDYWLNKTAPAFTARIPRHGVVNGQVITSERARRPGSEDDRMRLVVRQLFPESTTRVWGSVAGREREYTWHTPADLLTHDPLWLRLNSPRIGAPGVDALRKRQVSVTTAINGCIPAPARILWRGPALAGGMIHTPTWVLAWAPTTGWGWDPPMHGIGLETSFVMRHAPMGRLIADEPNYETTRQELAHSLCAALYHPTRHEVIILTGNMNSADSASSNYLERINRHDEPLGAVHYSGQVMNAAGPFIDSVEPRNRDQRRQQEQDAWLREAELILFTCDADTRARLPIRATLKPDAR